MYSERYLTFTKQILRFEGGKIDNPKDHGGRTAYGVTQRVYDSYRKLRGLIPKDVFDITHDEILEIYFRNYYVSLSIETIIPISSAYIIYDYGVNSGVKNGNFFKMHLLVGDPIYLLDKREQFYYYLCQKRPQDEVFLKGWMNRLIEIAKIYNLNWKPKL